LGWRVGLTGQAEWLVKYIIIVFAVSEVA